MHANCRRGLPAAAADATASSPRSVGHRQAACKRARARERSSQEGRSLPLPKPAPLRRSARLKRLTACQQRHGQHPARCGAHGGREAAALHTRGTSTRAGQVCSSVACGAWLSDNLQLGRASAMRWGVLWALSCPSPLTSCAGGGTSRRASTAHHSPCSKVKGISQGFCGGLRPPPRRGSAGG